MRRLTVRDPLPLLGGLLAILLFSCAGCRSTTLFSSTEGTSWIGLGLSFPLPAGDWKVAETEAKDVEGRHFESQAGAGDLVVMRKPLEENVPPWVLLQDLFVEFKEKELKQRRRLALKDGRNVECAEYLVDVDGRSLSIASCVLPHPPYDYAFTAWNAGGGSAPDLDALLDGLTFLAPDDGEGAP
jgi:hypothetical protein